MMRNLRRTLALLALGALLWPAGAQAQGVTTSEIRGTVTDPQKQTVPGATVVAVHEPSGTKYETITRADGGYTLPGLRVGGPYTVSASLTGFQPRTVKDIQLNLGVARDLDLEVGLASVTEEVTVTAEVDPVFSSGRTGAATSVDRNKIDSLPTITDRLESFTRLTPQYSNGPFGASFLGMDARNNNITVDGSYFNNSFGLQGTPGERTGVAPISMAAIEAVQVNVAPYDVRQGNFVGAGVNSITRSGTNDFRGEAYYWWRNAGLVGEKAKEATVNPGTFDYNKIGAWISGPIKKNKLFFFVSAEDDALTQPGTTFVANRGETVGGNFTRVKASDLDALSAFLSSNFDYDTGPFEGYDSETPSRRYLAKIDYNLSDRNKLTFRYNHLDSDTDVLASTSSSLGNGRSRSTSFLNFQNTNYKIKENIRSGIAEWNAILGTNTANNLIVGFTKQDESRESRGAFFPFVDIIEAGTTYTSFGFEPFTPNNELRYKTFQLQDNFTMHRGDHAFTFGLSAQRYESENVFFPGSQSVYVYNSLADFYRDANDYLANPNRTTSPVTLRRFQLRWINIPGLEKPVQPLEVWFSGLYAQDEWRLKKDVKVTAGLRVDVAKFGDTGFANSVADALTFRDENGDSVQYSTAKLPDARPLFSPRVGFNWDVNGKHSTQVRGGSGIFTGPPPYVWISNQIGNTGVLTGAEQLDNTTARPFNPDPNRYKPTNVTGAPASSFELALTDDKFKFAQVWRSNLAVDQKLPWWGLVATGEFVYHRDINGTYYINANLPAAQTATTGADVRPRWTSNRIHSNVINAIVLKNENEGRSIHVSGTLEKTLKAGFLKAAYSYGRAKNTIDPGSIAAGSWTGNHMSGDPNNPGLSYSNTSPGTRMFVAGSYRFEFLKFGATRVGFIYEGYTIGNSDYTYGGDVNNDGSTSNDLIYIPRDVSEMNFQSFTIGTRTFSAAEQAAAWEAYIQQDKYLRAHRGQFAERNAVFLPMVWRGDLSLTQELFKNIGGRRHGLEFRADILNFPNLINSDWGVGQRFVAGNAPFTQPLTNAAVDAQGRITYRLRVVNNELIKKTFEPTASLGDFRTAGDVYRIQFQLRYSFN